MAGWLWVVAAVVLGVVIFLLLRSRGGSGRHRAPAVEYVPPVAVDDVEQPSDIERMEDAEPVEDVEVRKDVEEMAWAPEEELTPEEEEQEELEWAHGAAGEDAELRHDEGYVETFGNDRTDATDPADDQPDPSETVAPAEVRESGYGTGSAVSRRGAAGPEGWTVKGNADSLLFYTEDAPGYGRAAADVWFDSEDAATAAGFTRWDAHHR
jgi:hypothetical protein